MHVFRVCTPSIKVRINWTQVSNVGFGRPASGVARCLLFYYYHVTCKGKVVRQGIECLRALAKLQAHKKNFFKYEIGIAFFYSVLVTTKAK
ncbi:hypothetical protein MGG_15893 [Pyricularia oryzae 70-15]|uniref:Uncharacterized protein n=2 Tax=Pyricularia oryzae TaxID=318829 RepID=G4MUK5_PYRO7|nr:uncharacterized protein MGG_15893 [Pyricularia oryzae 70-15]EHA55697.1 hypothetical protein MGG_15893 [Pyricularia oryzae 70-15]